MMSKKVYLAGKMSNVPYFNFPAFFKYAEELRTNGYEVFNPAENDINHWGDFWKECPKGTHEELEALGRPVPSYRDCLRMDLNWILDHADAIALIPGWETGRGTLAEKALADCLNLEIINLV